MVTALLQICNNHMTRNHGLRKSVCIRAAITEFSVITVMMKFDQVLLLPNRDLSILLDRKQKDSSKKLRKQTLLDKLIVTSAASEECYVKRVLLVIFAFFRDL